MSREVRKSPAFDKRMTELMKMNEFFEGLNIDTLNKYGFVGCMGMFNVLNSHVRIFIIFLCILIFPSFPITHDFLSINYRKQLMPHYHIGTQMNYSKR